MDLDRSCPSTWTSVCWEPIAFINTWTVKALKVCTHVQTTRWKSLPLSYRLAASRTPSTVAKPMLARKITAKPDFIPNWKRPCNVSITKKRYWSSCLSAGSRSVVWHTTSRVAKTPKSLTSNGYFHDATAEPRRHNWDAPATIFAIKYTYSANCLDSWSIWSKFSSTVFCQLPQIWSINL